MEATLEAAAKRPIYKQCSVCGRMWEHIEAFLGDPEIQLVGYMAIFDDLSRGLFMFNHSCRTTLASYVEDFSYLHKGPIFQKRMTGTEQCPGYCLHKSNLEPCPNECECAWVRETSRIIREWPKVKAPSCV